MTSLTIIIFGLLLITDSLSGQTNPIIPELDAASQGKLIVIVANAHDKQPCPPDYTNLLSNTNLFTLDEQLLLNEIPMKYGNVTTDVGPLGSVLLRTRSDGRDSQVIRFQFTNSDAYDDVTFGGGLPIHRIRNQMGEGYDLVGDAQSYFNFRQVRQGKYNGLVVDIDISHSRCMSWMCFSNGMAVDKWLQWDFGGDLIREVKFKEPYDFFRYSRKRTSF
jgi:hypothetical protein